MLTISPSIEKKYPFMNPLADISSGIDRGSSASIIPEVSEIS